jgi:hypothetical protein
MSVMVIYLPEAFLNASLLQSADCEGVLPTRTFFSLEEARLADFPEECEFACVPAKDGYHVFSHKHDVSFFETSQVQ